MSPLITRFLDQVNPVFPILDIGAGQGRNTIPLAELGFKLHAIEPSNEGVQTIQLATTERDLKIKVYNLDFQDFRAEANSFGAIFLIGVVPWLSRPKLSTLTRLVDNWLAFGGLVFVSAFRNDDTSIKECSKDPGSNSFLDEQGNCLTYLLPGEVTKLFPSYKHLHHSEQLGPIHQHGQGPGEDYKQFVLLL